MFDFKGYKFSCSRGISACGTQKTLMSLYSTELVTCASVTEMFVSQQCFENKILKGSGDSKALLRHLVPFV